MADEDTSAPQDDIRSALAQAIASSEGTGEQVAGAAEAATTSAAAGVGGAAEDDASGSAADPAKGGERVRNPDGTFAKADAKPKPKAAAKDGAEDVAADAAPTKKSDAEAAAEGKDDKAGGEALPADGEAKLQPIEQWSKQHKELFALAPPNIQAFMLEREKQIAREFTKRDQQYGELKREYEPVDKILAPYKQQMAAKGFTPATLIQAWGQVEQRLAAGDGVNVVVGLVNGYKLDRTAVARALGLTAAPPQQQNGATNGNAEPPVVDGRGQPVELPPELLAELRELRTGFQTLQQERQTSAQVALQERERTVMSSIENFKSETDGKGNLLRPYFGEVEDDMTALAQAAIARKQPVPPLDKLYETAVWANPSTREKLRTAEMRSAEQRRADEARAKAAAARKASSSVTGAPGTGQAPNGRAAPADQSLRATLEAAAADLSGA